MTRFIAHSHYVLLARIIHFRHFETFIDLCRREISNKNQQAVLSNFVSKTTPLRQKNLLHHVTAFSVRFCRFLKARNREAINMSVNIGEQIAKDFN